MKTKDEILNTKNWNSEYPNYRAECEIEDAMDEYGKAIAIGFAQWIEKRRLERIDYECEVKRKTGNYMTVFPKERPIDELYELYLKTLK